jgi:hypothetical protein
MSAYLLGWLLWAAEFFTYFVGYWTYIVFTVYLAARVWLIPGLARIAPLSEYPPDSLYWSSGIINPSDAQRIAIGQSAHAYAGKHAGYSALDYFALAAHRLHIPAPHLRSYIASSGHMICSQFVDQCYSDAGIQLFSDRRWQGDVTPGALYQLLKNHAR